MEHTHNPSTPKTDLGDWEFKARLKDVEHRSYFNPHHHKREKKKKVKETEREKETDRESIQSNIMVPR